MSTKESADKSDSSATIDADAMERRRHAPSPPCLPPDATQEFGCPIALADAPIDERRRIMAALAEALDALHGFRLAHGRLAESDLRWDGKRIWLEGVEARWKAPVGGVSPRQADLDFLRRFATSALGEPYRFPAGGTARALLDAWNSPAPVSVAPFEPAPTLDASSSTYEPLPPTPPAKRKIAISRWLVGCTIVVLATSGVVGYGARRGWFGGVRGVAAKSATANKKSDTIGSGVFDDHFKALIGMYNRRALIELLCSEKPEADAVLLEQLDVNDPALHAVIGTLVDPSDTWAQKAAPRLKAMLGRPKLESAQRGVERAFLSAARPVDLPAVSQLLRSPRADTRADACWALARLEKAPTVQDLSKAAEGATAEAEDSFVEYALAHFSPREVEAFLAERLFETPTRPRANLIRLTRRLTPANSPAARTFDGNLAEVLGDAAARIAVIDGPRADADLLATVYSLWRLQPQSPHKTVASLKLTETRAELLRSRVARILLSAPESAERAHEWDLPDAWYSAAAQWSQAPPYGYALAALQNGAFGLPASGRQARLLALADLPPSAELDRLLVEVAGVLKRRYAEWKHSNPELISGAVAWLAAADSPVGRQELAEFFGDEPLAREPAAWDGLLLGAIADPPRWRTLVARAGAHPLQTISKAAQGLLALADGDAARWRKPTHTAPPVDERLSDLVERLDRCLSEIDALAILSRERDAGLASTALGLSRSEGVRELLLYRVARGEAPYATFTAMSNAPQSFDPQRFDEFLRRDPPFQLVEQVVLRGVEVRGGSSAEAVVDWLALYSFASRTPPPVGHRATALTVLGSLKRARADRGTIDALLALVEGDASKIVRRTAAAAAVRMATPAVRPYLREYLDSHPTLDRTAASLLELSAKL